MLEVLLIEPPPANKFGNLRTLGSMGTFKADMAWPPLDLMIIAGYLKKNKINSEILDANTLRLNIDEVRHVIRNKKPKVVIFTTSTPTIYKDLEVAMAAKAVSYDIKTVAIGTHCMAMPEDTLQCCAELDCAVISESEPVILNLIRSGYDFKNTLGIAYQKNREITINAFQPESENLDDFGFPAHDRIILSKYHDPFTRKRPMSVTYSSRGCINQPPCIMCSACFFGKDRYRDPAKIINEMHWMEELGIKEIRFPFESGFNNTGMAVELFNSMIKEKIKLRFTCNGRADRLTPELLKLMKEAGCVAINIGCETADETVMKNLKKMVTPDMVKDAVSNAKKVGLEVMTYFIFGLPGETKESIKKTFNFAKNLGADIVTFGVAIPHPGTEFYQYLKKNNLLSTKDWSKYDPMFEPPYSYSSLSGKEVYDSACKAYKSYYIDPRYIISRILHGNLKTNIKGFFAILRRYL